MKKYIKILAPILVAFAAAAIVIPIVIYKSQPDVNKSMLTFGDINIKNKLNDFEDLNAEYDYDIDYSNLKNKIENENFLLTVAHSGCSCWPTLSSAIRHYMSETNTICYRILDTEFENKDKFGIDIIDGNSTFAIFANGKVKKCLTTTRNEKEITNNEQFTNFINSNVYLPKMYYATIEDFDRVTLEQPLARTSFYIGRSNCGDCQHVVPDILKPYFESHKSSKNLYVLDLQNYYRLPTDIDYEDYLNIKYQCCLTSESNPDYGYDAGVFPSFLYFDEATCKSGAVAYNDTVEKQNDKYIITNSYYTPQRVEKLETTYLKNYNGNKIALGMELSDEEVADNNAYWLHKYANKFYKPIIEAFLDYTLQFGNDEILKKN